jgi:hypothetical protein
MTRLRPLVIPATAVVLATGAPSAPAQPRRPVFPPAPWAASPLRLASRAAERAVIPTRATPVRTVTQLPLAVLTAPGEAAGAGGRQSAVAEPTGTATAGRPITASARGPPL